MALQTATGEHLPSLRNMRPKERRTKLFLCPMNDHANFPRITSATPRATTTTMATTTGTGHDPHASTPTIGVGVGGGEKPFPHGAVPRWATIASVRLSAVRRRILAIGIGIYQSMDAHRVTVVNPVDWRLFKAPGRTGKTVWLAQTGLRRTAIDSSASLCPSLLVSDHRAEC